MKINKIHIIQYLFFLFLISSLLSSCGFFRKSIENKSDKKEFISALDSIKSHNLKFETFYSGFTGNFENNGKSMPIKGIIKIKKDTFIQISIRPALGIELAKILLTKDSVKIIDKIKNEYILNDYKYVKKKLGYDLDFDIIQSLLTNSFFEYPKTIKIEGYSLTSTTINNNAEIFFDFNKIFEFQGKKAQQKLIFSQSNYKLTSNYFSTFDNNISINISYSEFSKFNNQEFPQKLNIKLTENRIESNIFIEYKNIKLNKSLNYNFVIPDHYKPIKID